MLDPATAAAMGLTPEQQAQMQQLMLQQAPLGALSPEALAAVPTLPLLGEMAQVPLDAAAIAALNVPILGPDGVQLTPEQMTLLFGGSAPGFHWMLPPGAVLAGMPVAGPAGGEGGYKNWWEEHEEKVSGCRRQGRGRGGAGAAAGALCASSKPPLAAVCPGPASPPSRPWACFFPPMRCSAARPLSPHFLTHSILCPHFF